MNEGYIVYLNYKCYPNGKFILNRLPSELEGKNVRRK